MLLAIDVGNTNTLFALHDGRAWLAEWRTESSVVRTGDDYIAWLLPLLALVQIAPGQIKECIISCVMPQSLAHLRNFAHKYLGVSPMIIGETGVDIGINVNIDIYEEAGADRLVNAVGAHADYPGALVLIDSGTATTFDLVAENGDFEGGIIAPGLENSAQFLHQAAAKLPLIDIRKPENILGKNTVEAIRSGIFWGYVGLIEGLVARLRAAYHAPLTVIATGGVSNLFKDTIDCIDYFDPNITRNGLLFVARRNRNQTKDK